MSHKNTAYTGPSRLTKNTSYLTAALSIQKVLSFLYFIYLARGIGVDSIGMYTFALGFTSIFAIIIDFGLGPILTREVAKHRQKLVQYFHNILAIKVVLAVIALSLVLPAFNILEYIRDIPTESEQLVMIGMAIILLDSFTFTFYSVFRGLQSLQYEAAGIIIYQLVIVTCGSLAIFAGLSVHFVVLAILVGSIFNFVYSLLLVVYKAKVRLRFNWDWQFAKKLLKISAPFAIAGIFFKLNGTVDIVMLTVLAGERFVGWYGIAFKLITALTVLPGALATSYFPAMSQKLTESREDAVRIFEKAMRYLMIISLPIAGGVFVLSHKIVLTLYDKPFEASADALNYMALGVPFLFLNYPVGNLLNAANRQLINTMNMGIALVANFLLNLWLIPEYTFIGAAISMLVSTILLFALGLPWAKKIITFDWKDLLMQFIRIGLVSVLMTFALYQIRDTFHIGFLILIGMAVYFPILLISGAVHRHEVRAIYHSFKLLAARVL